MTLKGKGPLRTTTDGMFRLHREAVPKSARRPTRSMVWRVWHLDRMTREWQRSLDTDPTLEAAKYRIGRMRKRGLG